MAYNRLYVIFFNKRYSTILHIKKYILLFHIVTKFSYYVIITVKNKLYYNYQILGGLHKNMNPFFSLWLHPKQTARFLIDNKSIQYCLAIVYVTFFTTGIAAFQDSGYYPDIPYIWIALASIIGVPLIGFVLYFLTSGIIFLYSKLFKGTGSFWDNAKASILSYIINIFLFPFYIIWVILAPESFFVAEVEDVFSVVGTLLMIITGIWAFVVSIGAVAEANKFSNWRSFFTLLLTGITIAIPLIILIVIIVFVIVGTMFI